MAFNGNNNEELVDANLQDDQPNDNNQQPAGGPPEGPPVNNIEPAAVDQPNNL